MKEEMKNTQIIEIPEGTFEGNCSDCVYADWNDTDRYGRVYCLVLTADIIIRAIETVVFDLNKKLMLHSGAVKPHNN